MVTWDFRFFWGFFALFWFFVVVVLFCFGGGFFLVLFWGFFLHSTPFFPGFGRCCNCLSSFGFNHLSRLKSVHSWEAEWEWRKCINLVKVIIFSYIFFINDLLLELLLLHVIFIWFSVKSNGHRKCIKGNKYPMPWKQISLAGFVLKFLAVLHLIHIGL